MRHTLRFLIPILFAAVFLATGCHSPARNGRFVKVAVLDGLVTYPVNPKGEMGQEGWWFSAKDRYKSGNVGIQLGEVLARELRKVDGLDIYSRDDLSIYMAQKEHALKAAFPNLTSVERKQWLAKQDPIDYGKSLNVDYVVRSEVSRASTVTNRTFTWWYSQATVQVELWDVTKNQIVWQQTYDKTGAFDSQLKLLEYCARRVAKGIRKRDPVGLYGP